MYTYLCNKNSEEGEENYDGNNIKTVIKKVFMKNRLRTRIGIEYNLY